MSTVSNGRRRAFRSRHRAPMSEGGKLAIIFVSLALILFVLAVMLGNYLRSLAEEIIDDTTESSAETLPHPTFAESPDKMIGRGVIFGMDYSLDEESAGRTDAVSGDETDAETESADGTSKVKFNAVSVTLRSKDPNGGKMQLAYNSEVSLQYSVDACGETGLDEGVALIRSNWGTDVRICAIFEVAYTEAPQNTAGIVRAYEAALICELIDAGIDEILLLGFSDNTAEGLEFIGDIYEEKGRDTVLGLTLEFDYVNSGTADGEISALKKQCGFLVLDLHSLNVPEMQSAESLIFDRVSRTRDICRDYSIRIMLGCGKNPDCELQTASAVSAGADNVMTSLGMPDGIGNDASGQTKTE